MITNKEYPNGVSPCRFAPACTSILIRPSSPCAMEGLPILAGLALHVCTSFDVVLPVFSLHLDLTQKSAPTTPRTSLRLWVSAVKINPLPDALPILALHVCTSVDVVHRLPRGVTVHGLPPGPILGLETQHPPCYDITRRNPVVDSGSVGQWIVDSGQWIVVRDRDGSTTTPSFPSPRIPKSQNPSPPTPSTARAFATNPPRANSATYEKRCNP